MPNKTRRTPVRKRKVRSSAAKKGPAKKKSAAKPSAGDKASRSAAATAKPDQEALRTLTDLEQIRLLADPLRLRIVEQFCEGEFTTKQVAETLGEKPTKLYHHVDALERVGLIRLSRTRQNRGTLEKYYIAVARAFQAESSVFNTATGVERDEAVESVLTTVLQRTGEELRELADVQDELRDQGEKLILGFIEIISSPEELEELRGRIQGLLEEFQASAGNEPPKDARRHRLTLAFYPLDRGSKN